MKKGNETEIFGKKIKQSPMENNNKVKGLLDMKMRGKMARDLDGI